MSDAVVSGNNVKKFTDQNRENHRLWFHLAGLPKRHEFKVGTKVAVKIEGAKPLGQGKKAPCGCTTINLIKNSAGRWELVEGALLRIEKCFKGHQNTIAEEILRAANSKT